MNRRQLFRNALGLAGAVAVAPKILTEALPQTMEFAEPVEIACTIDISPLALTPWIHKTPADILNDMTYIYGICRAPGENDDSLKRRLHTHMYA